MKEVVTKVDERRTPDDAKDTLICTITCTTSRAQAMSSEVNSSQ
eukprot:COSAG06_NODE_1896_length_8121_cov_3.278733_9_plen_44_part_00